MEPGGKKTPPKNIAQEALCRSPKVSGGGRKGQRGGNRAASVWAGWRERRQLTVSERERDFGHNYRLMAREPLGPARREGEAACDSEKGMFV